MAPGGRCGSEAECAAGWDWYFYNARAVAEAEKLACAYGTTSYASASPNCNPENCLHCCTSEDKCGKGVECVHGLDTFFYLWGVIFFFPVAVWWCCAT